MEFSQFSGLFPLLVHLMGRAALSTPPVNAFSKAAKHKQTANEENLNLRFKVYLKDYTHYIVHISAIYLCELPYILVLSFISAMVLS